MTAAERDRIARIERAIGQLAYMANGTHGLPSLMRQAPDAAELVNAWLRGTTAATEGTFVGRRETTEFQAAERR